RPIQGETDSHHPRCRLRSQAALNGQWRKVILQCHSERSEESLVIFPSGCYGKFQRCFASLNMTGHTTKPRSIAFQLILLFTLAAALLLACGLGIFYSIVLRHAFAEDNTVLADKLSAISTDLGENGPEAFGEELANVRAGEHIPYWIRIIDSNGRTVAETPGMERLIPTQVFPPAQEPALTLRTRKDYHSATKLFSLVAFSENSNNHVYILQVAQDRSSDAQVEKNFALLFIVVLAGGVLASALIAIVVTRRGLQPLRQMTQSFGRVGPDHLKE